MLRVVADTGPLNYLILINEIELLPALFGIVSVPDAVRLELLHPNSPHVVRTWTATPPSWLAVEANPSVSEGDTPSLGAGETATIRLAVKLQARLILMDDRAGVAAARKKRLAATGTLGVLDLAARRGLLDLREAFERLRATTFRHSPSLIEAVLVRYERERGSGP